MGQNTITMCADVLNVVVVHSTGLIEDLGSVDVRTEVLSSGPQGQRRPRAGVAKGGLDQKGSVHPTEVIEYEIP